MGRVMVGMAGAARALGRPMASTEKLAALFDPREWGYGTGTQTCTR